MKAIVITDYGRPDVLQVRERPIPNPLDTEVVIKVYAAGINRPDVFQRKGKYPAPAGIVQDIPGLEVAGVVHSCGDKAAHWKVGDRVCALIGGGGYAQYAAVDEGHCLPVPDNVDFPSAACLPETVFTVWHNVFQRGRLRKGESLLVHGGSGGIGTTAIRLAKLLGADVYATAGTQEKCDICIQLGASQCVNYKEHDFAEQLAEIGIDVILDSIGGEYFEKNINLLRDEGRLVYINSMAGRHVQLDIMKIMQKRLTVTGSTLRARDAAFKTALCKDIQYQVWPFVLSAAFKPLVYRKFPFEEAAAAHELMESGDFYGKLVLEVPH